MSATDPLPAQIITPAQAPIAGNGGASGAGTVPVIRAYGRATAQTAAVASVVTFTVGASDATFEVSANVTVTTATNHTFNVTVTYTNEASQSQSMILDFSNPTTVYAQQIVNTNNASSYIGRIMCLRAKAGTTITVATSGTFTTVTYNIEAMLKQIA